MADNDMEVMGPGGDLGVGEDVIVDGILELSYQLVGPLSVRVKVQRFVESLRHYPPSEPTALTLPDVHLDTMFEDPG